MDEKLRQMSELEIHFHRWMLHEIGLPQTVVTYVDLVMRKRLLMGLRMSAEELQSARISQTGPWTANTETFIAETFTEDDLTEIRGIDDVLGAAYIEKELRGALKIYGRHKAECASYRGWMSDCDCGLLDLLQE